MAPRKTRAIVADWLRMERDRIEKDLKDDTDAGRLSPEAHRSRAELLAWIKLSIEELED